MAGVTVNFLVYGLWGALGLLNLFWLVALISTAHRRMTNPYRITRETYTSAPPTDGSAESW